MEQDADRGMVVRQVEPLGEQLRWHTLEHSQSIDMHSILHLTARKSCRAAC